MSAHVVLNLLYELGVRIRCEVFPNELNKLKNTGVRMQDYIYHMIL